MTKTYGEFFDFASIYTYEAHSWDGLFTFKNNYQINEHKSINDRINAAKELQRVIGYSSQVPLLVDLMDDTAATVFSTFAERLVVVLNGKMVWQGGRGPFYYRPDALEKWMEDYIQA